MDTEEEDTSKTPKKQKIEETRQIIQVADVKANNKHMKFEGHAFEIKEYAFSETPKDCTSQFKTRAELFDKYRDDKQVATNESLKLYVDVKKLSNKYVSLVTVRVTLRIL